jgi:hypothetical protein
MTVERAIERTLELAREYNLSEMESITPYLGYVYLVELSDINLERDLSSKYFWLGWLQAAVHSTSKGAITNFMIGAINREELHGLPPLDFSDQLNQG